MQDDLYIYRRQFVWYRGIAIECDPWNRIYSVYFDPCNTSDQLDYPEYRYAQQAIDRWLEERSGE